MITFKENRVYRMYKGGKLLDKFNSNKNAQDGFFPERWICSSTSAITGEGISVSTENKKLTEYIEKPLDILVKLIDSYTRLSIQVHPDNDYARKFFNSNFGKQEAWYILDTRIVDGEEPYIYLGFKKGITKERWIEIFKKQDIDAMKKCLHKISVKKGDTFLIPGKTPHAMGSGVFFAEVQQPTDLTLRTEWFTPDGRKMKEDDLHCKTSFEVLFNCFNYDGDSLENTIAKHKVERTGTCILENKLFKIMEVEIEEKYTINVKNYAIVLVLEGGNKGEEYFLTCSHTFEGKQKLLIFYGALH